MKFIHQFVNNNGQKGHFYEERARILSAKYPPKLGIDFAGIQ